MKWLSRLTQSVPPALFAPCLAAALLLAAGGCATIYPEKKPVDPVPVYVADYGVHSSLILPTPDGRFVEYAFGDWGYAAQNHCMPQDAVGALCFSFQAALGRRFVDLKPGETEPAPAKRPKSITRIYCSRGDVYDVVEQLDRRYLAARDTPRKNPETGLEFVRDMEHYSVANNCNHLTARSLQQLGCKVKGLVVSSNFHVAEAPAPPEQKSRAAPVPGWTTADIN